MKAILWLVALASLGFSCLLGLQYQGISDFAGYYTSARVFADGESLHFLYDDQWFVEKSSSFGIAETTFVMYVNPPSISLIMVPLSSRDPGSAKVLWNLMSIATLIIILLLTLKITHEKLSSPHAALLAALLVVGIPFLRNLQRGQIYLLMLLLLVLLWMGYTRKSPLMSAVPLSLMIFFKYFGWMFLLLFLAEKRWKELFASLVALAVLSLWGIALFGIGTYQAHFLELFQAFTENDFAGTALPNIPNLIASLFTENPTYNPHPVVDFPILATGLSFALLISALIFSLHKRTLHAESYQSLSFASVAVVSVLFTPLAADHHFVLLSLPLFIAFSRSWDANTSSVKKLLLIGIWLGIVGWFPHVGVLALHGWEKVLAFPRLYPAIALWLFIQVEASSRARKLNPA